MVAVTVLMGVHNGEKFLTETLASVAAQTFDDYEFIIVDDASSDATLSILADAAAHDTRVRVLRNEENLGLTRSLNRGLAEAKGDLIARIDADDVCLPNRLAVQVDQMRGGAGLVGVTSGFEVIDEQGRAVRKTTEPLDPWQVRWLLRWNPPAPHPTFMFRRCPDGKNPILYDETFRTAQDFDLWSRLVEFGPTIRLGEVLIRYRRHEDAITHAKRYEQAQNCAIIGRRNIARRFPADIVRKLEPLISLFAYNAKAEPETVRQAVEGADLMLGHDLSDAPSASHAAWMRRMTAGLLADAILSRAGGLSSPSGLAAFGWYARHHHVHLMKAVSHEPGTAIKALRGRRRA